MARSLRFSYDPQSRRILKEVTSGAVTTRVHYATGLYERHSTHSLRHIYLGTMMVATEKVEGARARRRRTISPTTTAPS